MQLKKTPARYIVLSLPFMVVLSATLVSHVYTQKPTDNSRETFENLDTIVEHLKLRDIEKAKRTLDITKNFYLEFPKDDWQANNKVLLVEAGVMLLFRNAAITRKNQDISTSLLFESQAYALLHATQRNQDNRDWIQRELKSLSRFAKKYEALCSADRRNQTKPVK